MASKIDVFNQAALILGDHRLVTTTDTVELRYALDSSWDRAVAFVFQAAFWRFTLKTVSLANNVALTALAGYTNRFALPATYYRPHAIFVLSGARECPVDVRQQDVQLYANVTPIYLRYVDNAFIADLTKWPELFAKAVAAYLAFDVVNRVSQDPQAMQTMSGLWEQYFSAAQVVEAVPPDPWLPHQLSGRLLSVVRELVEDGFWRFATKTVSLTANAGPASLGYAYSFTRPADWIRTYDLYETGDTDMEPLDYREENAQFHADYGPITLRYLSTTLALDSTLWPAKFETAVLAQLALRRALETPDTPGAVMQALSAVADDKLRGARSVDDSRERPRVDTSSRFVQGRFGYGRGGLGREQGW